ncbi:hypothetical protein [Streptomyces omiyaensis]|uniref:Uncharacterized protein n=1 Tax=Streptomyces omiyaensis TaxID=68247 RepID=A0ABW7BWI1_9ACTN
MPARTARPLAAGLALTGLALAGGLPAAYAAPGDRGDVKIHEAGAAFDDPRSASEVCGFYLVASGFGQGQRVRWEVAAQPGRAGAPGLSESLTLADGDGRTRPLALPDGTYRLTWTLEGASGTSRSRTFQVDCANGTSGSANAKGTGAGTGAADANGTNNAGGNGSWNGSWNGGSGSHRPPNGPVGAGGGGSARLAAAEDGSGSGFGVGAAVAAGLAGTAGLVLIRRSRRRDDGAA